jgi:hypothetical protein
MNKKSTIVTIGILILGLMIGGCSPYTQQVVPFKMPSAFPNMVQAAGMQIGAKAYIDPNEARAAFGFDIRGAGLLPVQVVLDNKGTSLMEISPTQTFLVDAQNNLWPILDKRIAYERAAKYSELAQIGSGAVKHGILAGVAGALIGAAIGIVSGQGIGEAAGKGAAIGAAAGATLGGAQASGSSDQARQDISEDLRKASLENRPIRPNEIVYGFIFFPGEAASVRELRLQFREIETGRFLNVALPF